MPKKYLGQNFLFDPSLLQRIIEVAHIAPDDTVVEIGPGHGRLTRMLAQRVQKVLAIELDSRLYERLKEEIQAFDNLELVNADALTYPYDSLGTFKVVANIPYYITTPIIFKLIDSRKNLTSMTLTVQKEVAERIVAVPHTRQYGVLSIAVQYYGKPTLEFIIPKEAFRPVPEVDSAVIHIEMYKKPAVDVQDEKLFFRIVRTAFSQRRKMVYNTLKGVYADSKTILAALGIDPARRPETLSIEEFAKLCEAIKKKMVSAPLNEADTITDNTS